MTSGKVELVEPSVLILGILSDEGCALGSITPLLPNLITFLMQLVENQYSILRSTTLWTLSQFTDFISEN